MKHLLFALLLSGCATGSYNTMKVGPETFVAEGEDSNILRANAFAACQAEGFPEYTVIDTGKNSITVRCEKPVKSFFSSASDMAGRAYDLALSAWNSAK